MLTTPGWLQLRLEVTVRSDVGRMGLGSGSDVGRIGSVGRRRSVPVRGRGRAAEAALLLLV